MDADMECAEKNNQTGSKLPPKADKWVQSSQQKRSDHFESNETTSLEFESDEYTENSDLLNFENTFDEKEIDISNIQSSSSCSIDALRKRKYREKMTAAQKSDEKGKNRKRKQLIRANMTDEETEKRKETDRTHKSYQRSQLSTTELDDMREKTRNTVNNFRKRKRNEEGFLFLAAAHHKKAIFYELGSFDLECKCGALHFPEEKSSTSSDGDILYNCCNNGKLIKLGNDIENYPDELKILFFDDNPHHKNFIKNIRRFNSSFACASISCFRFDFPTPGPPCYKIQGQIYHKFNNKAMPLDHKDVPTNGQLYFIDTDEATKLRCESDNECDRALTKYLDIYFRTNNKFAQSYNLMKDVYEQQKELSESHGHEMPNVSLIFSTKEHFDQRRYNIPQSNEVCAILVCNANDDIPPARMVVQPKGKKELIEIYPLEKSIEPMCYPLLYPTKTECYHFGLKDIYGKKISLCDYTKYHLFIRENGKFFPHFYARKLFQQWTVDMAARIEWDRLEYIRTHQSELCRSNYSNVEDFLKRRIVQSGAEIQKKFILPSNFTGGPRNMHEHFMDAMSIVNETGKPDLFITFTANPTDTDILKCLKPGQTSSDRPDIVSRVFELKVKHLLDLVIHEKIFGEVIGYCWTIEYQKRGLPHLHLLVTLHPNKKWHDTDAIDKYIWAEIPDKDDEPLLYEIVTKCMMHGPCNEHSLCWDKTKKRCKKRFPKPFVPVTEFNTDGYPHYKRPDNGRFVWKKGKKLTNQYVVPYSPYLTKIFQSHINVERVADISAVKYIYDYIYKGYDAATVECIQVEENGTKNILKYDEVGNYLEARYLSPCEACWRIFKFAMQGKSHSVDKLAVHLENKQNVFYKKNADEYEIKEASEKDTTLTAYFKFCRENPTLDIKYKEMPKKCTWDQKQRKWKIRIERGVKKIGRMIPVHPTETEKYYLYYLLLHRKGTSFRDLRTINGVEYENYAETCLSLGLIKNDDEWSNCLEEACLFSRKHPHGLRILFVNILVHCGPKFPEKLWNDFKDHMIRDIKRRYPHLSMDAIYKKGLILIEQTLNYQDKSLNDFKSMPQIDTTDVDFGGNEIYDPNEELEIANKMLDRMNIGQTTIINELINTIERDNEQKLLFIDGPGGTGKTFTLTTLYHFARSKNKKICNMAFSGIAATVLKNGRTLHNRFKLPLNINQNSTSGIEIGSKDAEEIKNTHIFVWDEAPMASRFILDIIDQKLREIMKNERPFGGKSFILSGDFRQIFPIKEFATRSEIIDLLIKNSPLWKHFKIIRLTENMRANKNEREFARELLEIGNGNAGENGYIKVPDQCICNGSLVDEIFGEILINHKFDKLTEHAILSPFNNIVDKYNEDVMEKFPGNYHTYLSTDETDPDTNLPITPDLLNSLHCTSLPNHKLEIKVNSMVMLLRNLNIREGLCNGTRLKIVEPGKYVIKCLIQNGDKSGETTLIPRVTLIEDKKFPFILRRTQFPVKPAFAFTINKCQSQTFSKVGIDYRNDPFTHGQTYTGISRVHSWDGVKIRLTDENKDKKIKNIVWKEALN